MIAFADQTKNLIFTNDKNFYRMNFITLNLFKIHGQNNK